MYQVVLEMNTGRRVHVIAEYFTKPEAINKYMSLVQANNNSPITRLGKYAVRSKPATFSG
ncbi:MAG: hypothetical protein SFT94_11115 [Pseudanabaenaceae cyanobacterium bins.68]|nr:hypothetical protein [Pseudanabaenaceae cyanobacterium bins.68]